TGVNFLAGAFDARRSTLKSWYATVSKIKARDQISMRVRVVVLINHFLNQHGVVVVVARDDQATARNADQHVARQHRALLELLNFQRAMSKTDARSQLLFSHTEILHSEIINDHPSSPLWRRRMNVVFAKGSAG